MASESFAEEDIHPIDIVEHITEHYEWFFDRITDDQIAMAIEGQWKEYSITLAWSGYEEMLKMVCSFEMDPPSDRMPQLFEVLNAVNDQCWAGGFTYWTEKQMMIYRYGLVLAGGHVASPDQIDTIINAAVMSNERFYPAIQLATWGGRSVEDAMQVAIAQAYGRA